MKPIQLNDLIDRLERKYLKRSLDAVYGNRSRAAKLLGLRRTTFVMKLERHGLTEYLREENRNSCFSGHPYTNANTYIYRKNGKVLRRCRTCTLAKRAARLLNQQATPGTLDASASSPTPTSAAPSTS